MSDGTTDLSRYETSATATPDNLEDLYVRNVLRVDISNVPSELAELRQWILWRLENDDKIPYSEVTGTLASSTKSETWTTLHKAFGLYEDAALSSARFAGIGFVFAADGGFTGIDLDGCRNPDTGDIAEWAQKIIDAAVTYGEISPSGTGVKLFVRGKLPGSGKNIALPEKQRMTDKKNVAIEFYDRGRYFAVTGQLLPGSPLRCADAQPLLDALWKEFVVDRKRPLTKPAASNNGTPSHRLDNRVDRCRAWVKTKPPAIAKQKGHATTFNVACDCFRFGLAKKDAAIIMGEYNQTCQPPWSEGELNHKIDCAFDVVSASGEFGVKLLEDRRQDDYGATQSFVSSTTTAPNVDPSDAPYEPPEEDISRYGDQVALANGILQQVRSKLPAEDIDGYITNYTERQRVFSSGEGPKSIGELMTMHKHQRPPIIHGLLREGETMNLIAAPKMGKSWLIYDLALSVVSGQKWLGQFETVKGDVLLIDNELYPESLATRIPKVAEEMQLEYESFGNALQIESLRGHLRDINSLNGYFARMEPGRFKLVIIDAWYRALPKETDENANGDMTWLYNTIDAYAQRLGCAFVLIHHASKGNQSGKSVTDVGAGAGAQSRAADTHLVLRPHEEDDVVVLDAAVRSWPSIAPVCLRWDWPMWEVAPDLDPTQLRKERRPGREDKNKDAPPKEGWTAARFTGQFVTDSPQPRGAILEAAEKAGLSNRRATDLFKRAKETRTIYEWPDKLFAAVEPPSPPGSKDGTTPMGQPGFFKRDSVEQALRENPSASDREIAGSCDVDRTYVGRIRRQLNKGA